MTIKFFCACGKRLKARDEMAARRSVCPRCGAPVGIPSLKPIQPGTEAGPLTQLDRLVRIRESQLAEPPEPGPPLFPALDSPSASQLVDTSLVRVVSSRKKRRRDLTGRHLEKHWHEVVPYPLRAWRPCLGLALTMILCSAGCVLFLPRLLAEPMNTPWQQAAVRLGCVLLPVLLVSMPCSFLDCVLASAVAGEVYYILLPGSVLLVAGRTVVKWVTCFLAGPILFVGVGYVYWLDCREPVLLDWLILAELGSAAAAYWIYALLAVTAGGRLRDVNPLSVADQAHQLGWRGLIAVPAAAEVLAGHVWLLAVGLTEALAGSALGWLLIAAGWLSGVFVGTFFCRQLGIWCHRSRQQMLGALAE